MEETGGLLGNIQKCNIESSAAEAEGLTGVLSLADADSDRLVVDSLSWPWLDPRLRPGRSDIDGAGDMETELALLAEEVATSGSVPGRRAHSK